MIKRILTLSALLISLLLVLCGCSGEDAKPAKDQEIKLYWNVERDLYYDANTRISTRMKTGDAYRVRFAIDGEQVDLFVRDSVTMDLIDANKFIGLSVDKDNVVTGVYKPHEFTGGVAAYEFYVMEIQDEQVLLNNISSGRGLPLKLKINENTGIYDVADTLLAGIPCELKPGDQIYAVNGLDGYASHIFVCPPFQAKPVYWNADRQYDNTSKYSTRTRSASGYYEIEFIVDGQSVIHKTKDTNLVDQIDGFAARCMSLEFDEEGMISAAVHAKFATGGATAASWYHVMRLDKVGQSDDINLVADGFYAEKLSGSDKGSTATLSYANDCKIYDMSGTGAYLGQTTELRLGDQIHCLTDPNGDVCIIFVVNRPMEMELYYNLERMYDSTKKESTRTKSSDGFYHFEMSVNGKQVSLKTKDLTIVNTIDARGARVLGLKLDGNTITAAYAPSSVEGANRTIFDYAEVTKIAADGTVTAERNGNTFTGKMAEGCEIYNVSNTASTKGEVTSLKVGDRVYGLGDVHGNVNHIYVVGRYVKSLVYWNLDRSYDSAAKTTKRSPAADGYYYIKLAVGTETKTYKTKNKALVDKLDSYVAVALQTNGDVITAVYKYDCAVGYSGGGFGSWMTVKSINGTTIVAANDTTTNTGNMIPNCPVYNVSAGSSAPVRPAKLKVGDKIHGIKNAEGQIVMIYVVSCSMDLDLYYNISRKWDAERSVSTRVPDQDGWYWFDMAVNGKQVKLKTKNITVVHAIDERAARVLGLELKEDQILAAYKPSTIKSSAKTVFDFAEVTKISGNTVTATRGGKTYTGTLAKNVKIYNVSNSATKIGEPDTVKVGDIIYGLGNDSKSVNHVFITTRTVDLQLYYNLERMWDAEKSVSTREADEDGWYWFTMIANGKQVQLKTKDVTVVNTIDERAAKVLGLELLGDQILAAYKPSAVKNATNTVFDFATVTDVSGNTITATRSGKTETATLAEDAKIYNVSQVAKTMGEYTTVQVGDIIYGLGSSKSVASYIYVTNRTLDLELYYNIDRKWDAEKSVSTREADADGWYWFSMSVNGKQVQLKTKDVTVVNTIDERAAKVLGLELQDNQILAAYKPSLLKQSTNTVFDFATVTDVSGNTITATRGDKTYIGTLAENAKIYNVSDAGAYTTVQVGDTIYGLGTGKDQVNFVYVTQRVVKPATKTALCSACNQTVEWQTWNGKSALTEGHWCLAGDITVEKSTTVAKDTTLCLDLSGHMASGKDTVDRLFNIYGVMNIVDSGENGTIMANYANNEGRTGSVFYVQNSKDNGTGTLNLYGGTLTSSGNTKQGGIGGVGYQFNMYGGTITGGKALKGGNLYLEGAADVKLYGGQILGGEAEQGADIYTKRNVTVGGNIQIGNIYLESGKTIAIDGLTEGASIGVTLAENAGTVASNATQADLEFFQVDNDLDLVLKGDELVIQQLVVVAPLEHEDHCVCGGWKDHTCETPTWEAWTGTWESGKYYALTQDHEVKSTIMIPEGQTLNLCLNGYDLIGKSNVTRIFNVYGELNLCDHADENGDYAGDVISNYEGDNTQTGRIFYVQNKGGAAFNMFGGNLISNSLTGKGGIGGTAKTVNIYAGTFTGGKATISGGNLQIDGGVTTIYTTISGGQAPLGGDIYVSNGQLVVSGNANIADVYLASGRTIQVKDLSQTASIGVTLADTYGDFATNAQESDLDRFLVAEGLTKVYADGKLTITHGQTPEQPEEPGEPEQPTVHQHCICGGLGNLGDHTCGDAIVWEPWTGTWESGKYYYLTEDYNLTGMLTIGEGKTLNLCLNGNDIIGGSNVNRMLDIRGVLNLCDHADEEGNFAGDVISHYDGTDTKTGRVFYLQTKDNAAFNMFGGNLKSNSTTTDGGIGGVGKIMNVYAGTITGGTATGKGGNLKVEARSAVLTIYGGTISGGTADNGGNIYISGSGTVVVNGGTIQGGLENNVKNATNGGNVYVEKGTLDLVSGTISGGYASNAGGSIRVQGDGVLNISGGILTGGRANGNGGNVYSVGAVDITGGSVTQGVVKSDKIGGNIYASTGGSLSITDDPELEGAPVISGGSAGTGGNIAIKVDNVTISGCTISGGTADKGGDIYFEKSDGTLTIADCGAVAVYVAAGTVNGDENVTITP